MTQKADVRSDKVGIASAVLCTVHCLVVPLLLLIKISWTETQIAFQLPSWWELIDYIFLAISFYAVSHSAKHTSNSYIRLSLLAFWCILAISVIFQAKLHWLAYIASAGLVITHLMNIRRMSLTTKLVNADGKNTASDSLLIK